MIVDIQYWGLESYRSWGFYYVRSNLVHPDTKSIIDYCSHLNNNSTTIVFTATKNLFGINHAYLASYFASKAIFNRRNFAKDLGMELLLYLSRQNQINIAIDYYGISDKQKLREEMWAVVFFASSVEQLLAEKNSLESFLGTSLVTEPQTTLPTTASENFPKDLFINELYLETMEKIALEIPNLPEMPSSSRERALLQTIIEKMAILSLDKIKLLS
ncbi:MAG: hypothetical protein RBG13Loki_3630 [Promethearchaeota archaeon CR_4]|nr:MAG: hypothetical protein RBG13Loki_3630 [Candidatus Lokiarchaeota archaeon CR_4]